jgi:3-isopropylmalate dehydrogenase
MKSYAIAVLPGDGPGPGIIACGQRAVEAAAHNFQIEWVSYPYSASHYLKTGEALPDRGLIEISSLDAIYAGPAGHPKVRPGVIEKLLTGKLRSCLDQYVGLRPVKLYPNVPARLSGIKPKDVNFHLVRENSEDFYVGIGGLFWRSTPGEMAVQAGVVSRKGCERIMSYAFELAKSKRMKLVTSCDKADTMAHSYGLWRKVFCEVSGRYKKIDAEFSLVNGLMNSLPVNPSHYNVIVAPNMIGDILSEFSLLLQGGTGTACGADISPKGISTFRPMSKSFEGEKNNANPMGAMFAGAMMLEHLGEKKAAERIERAVAEILAEGKIRTADIGGSSKTEQVASAVEKKLMG